MDRSIQYTQVMANFDSAYNTGANCVRHPTVYMPISSSASFCSQQTRSNPKFNLDLYDPNDYSSESFDYPSPSSSVIIHHHQQPVYSPPPSQAISKLRQINDELCHTLAQCDLDSQSQPSLPHYHVHHYPISRETSRSPSPREQEKDSSSTDSEPIPKKRNARITYKAHIPRRQNPLPKVDQLLLSTSDVYSRDDPMTVDLYPTRDQGFVRKIRNRPDNQSPWLADTSPIRRNSYSENSTYRTPRAPYYDNKPIQPNSRLASGKRRPRSSSVRSRIRPDTAPNPLRQSTVSFSNSGPTWRPSGSIKRPKFIGSNAPPSKPKPPPPEATWTPAGATTKTKAFRAFDPVSKSIPTKINEPLWKPPSKTRSEKPSKYFEPAIKPELIAPIRKQTAPRLQKKSTIHSADPKLKTRIANAESKVKSAWEEPTPTVTKPRPPIIPRPIKTTTIPPKPKVKAVPSPPIVPVKKVVPSVPPIKTDTGRSSLNDVPTKPLFQSTPRNLSIDEDPDDLFEEETQISEPPKKPEIPHPPPQIEKTPTKLPKTSVPEPDKGTKSTIKNGVLIHGDDDEEEEEPLNDHSLPRPPTTPKQKVSSPKPDNRDDVSVIDDEDINQPNENDTNADIEGNSAADDVVSPSIPKADVKTPSSLPQSPGQTLHQSPVDSKKKQPQLPGTPPPPPPPPPTTTVAAATNSIDDFFD